MSGDYTRFTHDPLKRRSGVLMQQGRVQLDSDWNEFVGIAKRRQRLQSLDTFGAYGVPYKTTPDAFLIGLIGPIPDLSIEPGRLYVEGRLAELFDTENATYLDQPFYPDPPPLPAGDSVVHLDVWEREVTYIEDASLLDVALGGADTATRTQTVWQVRVDARDAAVCDMDVGEEPSAGRLSTDAILPPAPNDPCILPPIAGYRGLENRLYRVEIHDEGGMSVARFKWSRDNGSIVSVVRGLAVAGGQTALTVNRIGRDPVLRFRIDDWVTVTDDHRELMGEPGEMARVIDIVETRSEVVLDRALPTPGRRAFGANPDELVARHTRIQRWDQTAATNVIDADGLIATAPGPIDLEDGIQISFDLVPAAGRFRAFDYWVFAARVADASLEILNRAPPRGIHHHYVQLAAITGLGGAAPVVTDCRPPPPADDVECCCSITVAVGESIQDAIDALPPEGGCVCLKTGIHTPRDTIVIARPNLKLTGESPGVFVDVMNGNPALFIRRTSGIRVDTITFRAAIESGAGVVMVASADDVAFFDCGMENREARHVIGVNVERTDRLRIEASTIRSVEVGIRFVGYCELPVVAGNRIAPGGQRQGTLPIAILAEGGGAPITITANTILDAAFGIIINDAFPFGEPTSFAEASVVLDNILIMQPFQRGDADRLIAIDVAADFCRISGNRIGLTSADHLAIRANGSGTIVNENGILSQLRAGDELRLPVGIQIGFEGEAGGAPTTEVVVADNRLDGPLHGIMAISTRNVAIHDNAVVGERGVFSFGILLNRTQNAAVTGNRIGGAFAGLGSLSGRANRFASNDVSSAAAGLFLALEAEPTVSTNRIHDTTLFGAFGIFLIGRSDFIENRLTACANQARLAIGLGALLVIGELHVEANEVTNTGMTPDNNLQAGRAIGIYGGFVLEARIESNLVTHTDALQRNPQREDRALLLGGLFELSVAFAPDNFVFGFPVQITANKFIGTGRMALVELGQVRISDNIALRFERVFFNENYCSHVSAEFSDDGRATVVLVGRAAVVMSNQIKATIPRFASVNFNGMRGPFIGNITRGGAINHVDFPAPENTFNQIM